VGKDESLQPAQLALAVRGVPVAFLQHKTRFKIDEQSVLERLELARQNPF
jgi:hypothetical protein